MPTFVTDVARDRELDGTETSDERFDRLAFAERAVALLKPANMRVAIAEGRSRVVVEAGRLWGRPDGTTWAMLCVPPMASRRAITAAVAALAGSGAEAPEPYVLDALFAEAPGLDA